jgi:hypothetical protein
MVELGVGIMLEVQVQKYPSFELIMGSWFSNTGDWMVDATRRLLRQWYMIGIVKSMLILCCARHYTCYVDYYVGYNEVTISSNNVCYKHV